MRLTEDTQDVAEGLGDETPPPQPAPKRPDAASASYVLVAFARTR